MAETSEFRCKCLPLLVRDHCMSQVWRSEKEALDNLKLIMLDEQRFVEELYLKYGENHD